MYGYLNFDMDRPSTPWTVVYFALPDAASAIGPQLDLARRKGAEMLIAINYKELSADRKAQLTQQVYGAVKYLPEGMGVKISFQMHMALAHFLQAPEQQAQRETRIAGLLDPVFKHHPLGGVKERGETLKALAVMVPDAAMNTALRGQWIVLGRSILASDDVRSMHQPLHAFVEDLCKTNAWNLNSRPVIAVQSCYFGRVDSERPDCLAVLKEASKTGLAQWLPLLVERLHAEEPNLLEADLGDTVFSAVESALDVPGQSADHLATDALARFRGVRSARAMAIVASTRSAMVSGVLFDSESQTKTLKAETACLAALLKAESILTPQRMRTELAHSPPPSAPLKPGVEAPDLNPIHARAVELLASWIDGLIESPDASALEHYKRIAQAEKQKRQVAAARTLPAPASNKPAPPQKSVAITHEDEDLTDHDVGLVVQSGLRSTAEFFLGEIQDLEARATQAGVDRALIATCMSFTERLTVLSGLSEPVEQDAVPLLTGAEAAIAALRSSIESAATKPDARLNFARALREALREEPLVYGKRHGRVIACSLRQVDWSWVHREFHQRWIDVQCLQIAGRPAPLRAHQALAFYVTGSSRSKGFAFDVSVHLWIRKEGCHSAPNAGNSPNAWMDTREWRDTHIPCAVLHVPSA